MSSSDRHSDLAALGSHRGSFGSFADLLGPVSRPTCLAANTCPDWITSERSIRSSVPGSLRVRLWQRRDPLKHAETKSSFSALGLIDGWPVLEWARQNLFSADLPTRRIFDVTDGFDRSIQYTMSHNPFAD